MTFTCSLIQELKCVGYIPTMLPQLLSRFHLEYPCQTLDNQTWLRTSNTSLLGKKYANHPKRRFRNNRNRFYNRWNENIYTTCGYLFIHKHPSIFFFLSTKYLTLNVIATPYDDRNSIAQEKETIKEKQTRNINMCHCHNNQTETTKM